MSILIKQYGSNFYANIEKTKGNLFHLLKSCIKRKLFSKEAAISAIKTMGINRFALPKLP